MTRPNGITTNYSYDNLSRLLSVLHQSGSTTLDGASYTVDNAGNRTSKTDQYANVTSNYTYDPIYELTQVTQATTTTESYTYDAVGNRLSSLGVSPYSVNLSNELTSTPSTTYTYDNNGNTVTKVDSTGTTQYFWDFENRLSSVTLPGTGGTVSFKYDPFGRRIYKSSSGGTSIYAYDGDNLVEETNSAGSVVARYEQTQNIDEPLAMLRSSATSYFHADGLGSVTSLSNSAGSIANTYTYDSFGKLTASTGSLVNPFQYTAREFDPETGLYYYRARYYDPASGRFISGDPMRFSGGDVNFYSYVRNDPTSLIDPFGLRPGDKYPSARCAGWNAENDYNPGSRRRTPAFPKGREYGGFIYKNGDGTYSYTDPQADNHAGVGTADSLPNFWNITIPTGTQRAGWYHTHGAFDPGSNGPGNPAPGQPGYNPNQDGNEIFSPDDKHISDIDLHGLPGYLGTPRGMVKEYMPIPAHPGHGRVGVLNSGNCGCGGQ